MAENIADVYLAGLRVLWEALDDDAWDEIGEDPLPLLAMAHGASDADLARLRTAYPSCPEVLVELLRRVDGTDFGVLGSDVEDGGFRYCLTSVDQILKNTADDRRSKTIREVYGDDLEEWMPVVRVETMAHYRAANAIGVDAFHKLHGYGKGNLDDRIDPDIPMNRWLHFADDWANNGGSSQLFVDFDPLGDGHVGQIVRYLHDPDSYAVIADSFDEYLQQLIDAGYPFALPDDW